MRITKTLMIVAVFALTSLISSAQAGTTLVVEPQASPAPGVNSFLVKAVADPGDLVASIVGLQLTNAHQFNENAVGEDFSGSLDQIGGTFWNDSWTGLDTHLLLDLSNPALTTSPGFSLSETNDESNPAGADLAGPTGFENFAGRAGIGGLQFEGNAPQITVLAPRPQEIDLLQVVAPAGTVPLLNVTFESDNLERDVFTNFEIVPEPSALILASLGAIGFVGRRRRS